VCKKKTIQEILAEIDQAYPLDIFPDTTQAERDPIISRYPGFIDRTSAMMGRHLANVIREKLAGGPTQDAPELAYACPRCGDRCAKDTQCNTCGMWATPIR
jgi:rubrerythrin